MKKLLLTLVISTILLNVGNSQIPEKAFTLTNSLYDLWNNGETEKAVESSLELYNLYPAFLLERMHNTLSQIIQDERNQNGIVYLEKMLEQSNDELKDIITPIYLWSNALQISTKSQATELIEQLNNTLTDSANYTTKIERYTLLIIKEFDQKDLIDKETKHLILKRVIQNLETFPDLTTTTAIRKEAEKRAWHRLLIAYSYNYLYSMESENEIFLKKASDYSPDNYDNQYRHAYFYDAALLTSKPDEVQYRKKYHDYLFENKRYKEALNLMCEIAFENPTDENIKMLQGFYAEANMNESFSTYWSNFIHSMGKPVPKVKLEYENDVLDLTQKPNKWIYIDVWGTWCRPCRQELPVLQAFFTESKENFSTLGIYTFSFGSQNLTDFMQENKYTFPVREIDKQINDLFQVVAYPTKILVTPYGNYINIPFGVDWKMYLKNYTLL